MVCENTAHNIALGLGVGVVIGDLFIWLYLKIVRWSIRGRRKNEVSQIEEKSVRVRAGSCVIEHSTGILERLVYILLLVSDVGAAGAFIGTWILIKAVVGWNVRQAWLQEEVRELKSKGEDIAQENLLRRLMRMAFISLHGSLVSLLFAILGAWLWCPDAL